MRVTVRLFATLRNYGPEEQQIELPDSSTLQDVMALMKLPEKLPILKIVNGMHSDVKQVVKEGDEIALFPPIAGGRD